MIMFFIVNYHSPLARLAKNNSKNKPKFLGNLFLSKEKNLYGEKGNFG